MQKRLREISARDAAEVVFALLDLAAKFGDPHGHSGLGIRKLARDVFECRAGLRLRCIFLVTEEGLVIEFIGRHDEVRRWLQQR